MTYSRLPSRAGVDKDNSPLEAELTWTDANKIRFVGGLPETIYGWERASGTALPGLCRGAFTYADNARSPIAAFGTHLGLYAMDIDGNITDITPAVAYGLAALNLTTTLGSALVTVTGWTHGLAAGQKFAFGSSTTPTVGGVTVDGTYVAASRRRWGGRPARDGWSRRDRPRRRPGRSRTFRPMWCVRWAPGICSRRR